MALNRYAKEHDGGFEATAGALPYYIHDENGDPKESSTLDDLQRAAFGWHKVEQRGWRDIDQDIEIRTQGALFVEEGKPIEEWTYSFKDDARAEMLKKVDRDAENLRLTVVTPGSGQALEYERASEEAKIVKALAPEDPITDNDYPFLEADLNSTHSPLIGGIVTTIREAADLVLAMEGSFKVFGAAIRKVRLKAKADITAAANDQTAYDIYKAIVWPTA
ncbi:hypothetical protein [Kiloniella sp.]|uniref:hypothetical protein n=1 Tax=Kiloniella sp. TaxID=1938587 RepID=UPI003B014113